MSAFRIVCLILFLSAWEGKAASQQISHGACSPNIANVGGNVQLSFKCDTVLVEKIEYQVGDQGAALLAQHYAITTTAVHNFFKLLTGENVAPADAPARLEELVRRVKALEQQLRGVQLEKSLEAKKAEARLALENGDLDRADQLLTALRQALKQPVNTLTDRIADAVRTDITHGDLKLLRFQYDDAKPIFADALDTLPAKYKLLQAQLKVRLAEASAFGTAAHEAVYKTAEDAVGATEGFADEAPALRMRAIGILINAYIQFQRFDEAYKVFDNQARPLLKKGGFEIKDAAVCFSCIGKGLMDAQLYDEALNVLLEGQKYVLSSLSPDPSALYVLYLNAAICYDALGKPEEGAKSLALSEVNLRKAYPEGLAPGFIYVYIAKASRAESLAEEQEYKLKAFSVAQKLFRPMHSVYWVALRQAVMGRGLSLDGGSMSQMMQPPEFIQQLYALHLAALNKAYPDNAELFTKCQFELAQILVENGVYDISLPIYTDALQRAEKAHLRYQGLGEAYFTSARILSADDTGTDPRIEGFVKKALAIYEQDFGSFDSRSQDARAELVSYLVRLNRKKDAKSVIEQFEKKTANANGADKETRTSQLSHLRQIMQGQ